jgi:hypothetical protein
MRLRDFILRLMPVWRGRQRPRTVGATGKPGRANGRQTLYRQWCEECEELERDNQVRPYHDRRKTSARGYALLLVLRIHARRPFL